MIDMAAVIATADMTILKDTQILVNVEEALSDILVVSYLKEDKRFQGVLLDSTKRNLPYGVYSLHPAFTASPKPGESNDDKLHAASQRFAYQEPGYARKSVAKSKPQARAKMTVRLRPRKVLCSKCKGICNENNENVDVGRKRKLSEQGGVTRDKKSVLIGSRTEENRTIVMRSTLIPKISRLQPSEISNAINGNVSGKNEVWIKSSDIKSDDDAEVVGSNKKNVQINNGHDADVCPKKRNNNSGDASAETDRVTQELTFVNVSDAECGEGEDGEEYSASSAFSNTRTLKISFGEGEGTVLKIPAIVGDFNPNGEKATSQPSTIRPKNSKAAKKALKKAKKQARKRVTLTPFTSPRPSTGSVSPRYIGALSPRYAATQDAFQRKHKHKVKHKKKHKVERKYGKDDGASKGMEVSSTEDSYATIEKHCLKRKLSISLKRLSASSYGKNGTDAGERTSSESESEAWESEGPCEGVPAFPAAGGGGGGTGGEMREGDVVWGKVTGFPWWPGRVLAVRGAGEAHVAWYASNTSSLMPSHSLSPFLEDYKLRFNKKKRGPYKEAVKLATIEAQKERRDSTDIVIQDPLASTGGVAPPTVSPRPIDVLS